MLTFKKFSRVNAARCEDAFAPIDEWKPEDWVVAVTGEWGEACNVLKKMRRIDSGTNTSKDPDTVEDCLSLIGEELADTITYIDLLATRLGIDLEKELINKFNKVSDRMNSHIRLDK